MKVKVGRSNLSLDNNLEQALDVAVQVEFESKA